MATPTRLRGIAWNHTRGYLPLVATAQRFSEIHPEAEIVWEKRSLQAFADYPIEKLAQTFDLLVVDHPFVGFAAAHPTLLPLEDRLPAAFLDDLRAHSVGPSYRSYVWDGRLWALPIDAATPCSAHRPDLCEAQGISLPQTWEELLALARAGRVIVPAFPIDCLMYFLMFCATLGEGPTAPPAPLVSNAVGSAALEYVQTLIRLCPPECLARNPIATYEALADGDEALYCPFAYTYSNYARPFYARHPLRFGGLVTLENGRRLRSTLGGTGLAISQRCQNIDAALAYAQFVAGAACQRGIYVASGGQPAHRAAWVDPAVDAACGHFFADTLPTLEEAYVRPRYDGYLDFQDRASPVVHRFVQGDRSSHAVLKELETLWQASFR